MSEEEIIEMLKHSIDTYIEGTKVTKVQLSIEEVKTLLDLYNKEKEKNKQWEDKIKAKIENREISINDINDNFEMNYGMVAEIKRLEDEIYVLQELLGDIN